MAGGMLDNSPDGRVEGRQAVRVNLFMAATLRASGVETAVKIRDLSATGAQIECSLSPDIGSPITLTRGRLSVAGNVTWCTERRCGLHFSRRISVPDWMANPVNREQQRVDHLVAAVKAGAVPLVIRNSEGPAGVTADGIGEDLRRVSQLLENLGDTLAGDPAIVARHGTTLQNLDIAMQTLIALAETMQANPPTAAASIARLDELRTSCSQALQA
jgi:hypothetical protein